MAEALLQSQSNEIVCPESEGGIPTSAEVTLSCVADASPPRRCGGGAGVSSNDMDGGVVGDPSSHDALDVLFLGVVPERPFMGDGGAPACRDDVVKEEAPRAVGRSARGRLQRTRRG